LMRWHCDTGDLGTEQEQDEEYEYDYDYE
jgi:hypothetical protein